MSPKLIRDCDLVGFGQFRDIWNQVGHMGQKIQLAATGNIRVAVQALLQQGGAGAYHADYKHGSAAICGSTHARWCLKSTRHRVVPFFLIPGLFLFVDIVTQGELLSG